MNIKKHLSKVLLVTALSGSCIPLINANTVYAYENDVVDISLIEKDISSGYLTGYLDENNEVQLYTHEGQERGIFTSIAVFIGRTLVGYLVASIVDGIVIAATGKSGGEWVAVAIKSVVGKRYTGSVYLPASGPYTCPGVVIDHSGMCP